MDVLHELPPELWCKILGKLPSLQDLSRCQAARLPCTNDDIVKAQVMCNQALDGETLVTRIGRFMFGRHLYPGAAWFGYDARCDMHEKRPVGVLPLSRCRGARDLAKTVGGLFPDWRERLLAAWKEVSERYRQYCVFCGEVHE